MSSILRKLPSKERLQQVKQIASTIFSETYNPQCKRNGSRILKAELKGPEVVNYYGVNNSMPTFKDFQSWFPELQLVDPREVHRLKMIQTRKLRNKGAPKKKSS
ncbi:Mitochondrial 37S ribosomal protein S27 [Spathaspora sp. JA1]|nr:Mitochondrial 37S ribosomal protein S27 [Spathaspora sp. JA1]